MQYNNLYSFGGSTVGKIKRLLNALPIETEKCLVRRLEHRDIDWYVLIMKSQFFNEYLDNKTINISEETLKKQLINLLWRYKYDKETLKVARTVVLKNTSYIGGLSFFDDLGSLFIGYWILPEFQGQGYGFEVLRIGTMLGVEAGYKSIKLMIREDNIKSLNLARKAGYKCVKRVKGREGMNLIFEWT